MNRLPRLPLLAAAALLLSAAGAETITFSADSMTGRSTKGGDRTTLSGSAHVVTRTMEISADTIELSGTDFRHVRASGNVHGVNAEGALRFDCQELTYDRTTKVAVLRDGVHLTDEENGVEADAELAEYDQESQTAVLQIGVSLTQKDNTCTGAHAVYQKAERLLTLSGNPRVQQGGNVFRAQEITLNLDTQEIALDGRVRGSVTTSAEEGPEDGTEGQHGQ